MNSDKHTCVAALADERVEKKWSIFKQGKKRKKLRKSDRGKKSAAVHKLRDTEFF